MPKPLASLRPLAAAFILLTGSLRAAPAISAETESPRTVITLTNWEFAEDKTPPADTAAPLLAPPAQANWKPVSVPHIFRQSGLPDEAAGWYRLAFDGTTADRSRRVFLILEGAASVKDVFVNGQHVGQHKGSFTRSTFDLTPALHFDQANELAVRVSNRDDETQGMLARSTLYFVNGGMFRHARLVKTGAVHIAPDLGSSGVYLTPAAITAARAELGVRTVVSNPLSTPASVVVRHLVTNPAGAVCARFETTHTLAAGETVPLSATGIVEKPDLWDFAKPNLYSVRTELLVDGRLSDVVTERTGFRTITFAAGRFQLNGREVQFRGVNKHEQNEYAWNAVGDDEPLREWSQLVALGVNTVRLAHYPHSHLEYNLADQAGIAVWAENAFAGHAWKGNSPKDRTPTPDGERLTREMVRQNWNHPSILFWSCGNETIVETAARYADVIRTEGDPNRLVTYASNGGSPTNCDFIANNTYSGWYGGHFSGFAELPRNALISETGCGDWITHHVPYGTFKWSVDKYEPEEYGEMFTEFRLQTICRNATADHPMFLWWTFREFYDRKFKQNRNTKGLLTLSGQPKDLYYLFQSFLNPSQPVVHLNGRTHFLRHFAADNGIKAYANTPELTLTLNGVVQSTLKNGAYRLPDSESKAKDGTVTPVPGIPVDNVFFWQTPLAPGRNLIEVSDGHGHRDTMVIYHQPADAPVPADPAALVQDLRSANPTNPAFFIDRPVEAQGAVYTDVDGSSDNTFDLLPPELNGAAWIATRRLSDPANQTDLSFRVNPASAGATAYVLFSTGTHPVITLKPQDPAVATAAEALARALTQAGFKPTGTPVIWRDHLLNRSDAALWSRSLAPGQTLALPGYTLDYVVLLKPAPRP